MQYSPLGDHARHVVSAVLLVAGVGAGSVTGAHAQSSLPGSTVGGGTGPGCVIALDPGHNGEDTDGFDPVTGVRMIDYPNGSEDADALEITRAVQSRLALAGIGTEVLKTSVDEDVTCRERVDRASTAGAFMGVSVHTTPGADQSAIFPQRQDAYRAGTDAGGEHRTVSFDNPGVAAESQRLSGVVAGARSVLEGGEVPVRDNSFAGRDPLWEGNIPVISLIADMPWIYNEFGSATGGGAEGITAVEKARYIDGLTTGLIAAAAMSPTCTGVGLSGAS
ncbi:MAG: N-acetylmuramoyl-L-alanine amidase [Corynebacterium sp.]|uniref:N-acetylmuramoyl-L-alanine amidase n=1 Tax=Corynebacterium sp. TaxID=1720 RepID=UPI003F123290